MTPKFISRDREGRLQIHNLAWESFKDGLLNEAKNIDELEFIGQLVEDLQHQYDERMDELE